MLQLFGLFFKMGCIAFGGPAAHIAMLEEIVVRRKGWMTRQHFLNLLGATNLIPGPNSTEMVMHCGYERAGWPGLVAAALGFITPGATLTALIAYFYQQYGRLPFVAPILYGIKPVVLAIVLVAAYQLGQKALKNWPLGLIGLAVLGATLAGASEIWLILIAGGIGVLWLSRKKAGIYFPWIFLQKIGVTAPLSHWGLFWVFLKIGALLYGSGYALIAYLEDELVTQRGWLSSQQLIDAVAVGQITPGPLFSTATFIGYQLGGASGALLATVGIFLPAFVFVGLLNPLVPRLRQTPWQAAFMDAVNIASVAVMLAITLQLGRQVIVDVPSLCFAVVAFALLFHFPKIGSWVWILAGGVGGWLVS
jgi:chromate transporter